MDTDAKIDNASNDCNNRDGIFSVSTEELITLYGSLAIQLEIAKAEIRRLRQREAVLREQIEKLSHGA